MNKLKLQVEDLAVESFDTTRPQKAKGTVFGEQCTCYTQCTCPGCPTCYASCNGTCDASCNGTCDASCNGTCDATCNGCDTWDVSCGCTNDSCGPTCYGWITADARHQCVDCMAGVY
ncbi:hypothetical protein [Longimicrobium sp.]|uniref:hypothetical protein n=1 Tax=Longimicrobium sp. TaxID=2029185 RepID=UPI003B3A7F8C